MDDELDATWISLAAATANALAFLGMRSQTLSKSKMTSSRSEKPAAPEDAAAVWEEPLRGEQPSQNTRSNGSGASQKMQEWPR